MESIDIQVEYPTLIRYTNYELEYDIVFDIENESVSVDPFDSDKDGILIPMRDYFTDDDIESPLPIPLAVIQDSRKYLEIIALSFPQITNTIRKYQ